ncbi:MAG: arginine--tRNA ligase [Sterolibacterium sp.]|jgi:arginyl-tRNA synthetase
MSSKTGTLVRPMPFDPKSHVSALLTAALSSVAPEHASTAILLERPKQASHGDFASNLALQLAKALKANPREIAQRLVRELEVSPWVDKAEVAGAGFINFYLAAAAKNRIVAEILAGGDQYGKASGKGSLGNGKKLQVEFVSANPTGPLHVGHGRGAAYGASLATLLAWAGYAVSREYYVNDAGRQMDILGLSTWLRYLALFDEIVPFPANAYQGDYVIDMARQIRDAHADRYLHPAAAVLACVPPPEADPEAHLDGLIKAAKDLLGEDWAYIHQHALTEQLADCRADLEEFGVHYDMWFSERSLFDTGMVAKAVERLEHNGHIYLQDGAKWFRSTSFGDEKDRVVQRDNGLYTYFASDIAYHLNKLERGFDQLVDIWGADHHGYIQRVRGALRALGCDDNQLNVVLVQFVSLWHGSEKVSMSTRGGQYVTLRELRAEVGNDACRFFYMLRKSDQALDFDLDLAKSQSNDNPVYYVQYAHARVCSVLASAPGMAFLAQCAGSTRVLEDIDLAPLSGEREMALCARLAAFPEVIEAAARDYAPHAVAFYLRELAAEFHSYYNAERILVDDLAQRTARLALVAALRQVLRNGFTILGVSAPESM